MENGKDSDSIEKKEKKNPVERISGFIVDKRKAFYLIYLGLAIFCIFSRGWVNVNNDLTSYLPEETETRQGLTIMNDEFVTFASAEVMVDNISYKKALELSEKIEAINGVASVKFDDSESHFTSAAAMFSITFTGEVEDEISKDALNSIKELLSPYDVYIKSEVGNERSAAIASEMQIVMIIAVVIILLVLLFTSQTYMEIPVLILTFGLAALLNMGTNFIFGEISFVSNSVAVVLQLALAIDYAIILCHRYTEERAHLDINEAAVVALSKAIPEICGSSLTTLSGLAAMTFMRFRIGYDLGIVLMKAIILSLLAVFTLMPGLLVSFGKLIDKTHHKNFVPEITGWGRAAVKSRYIVPPIFVLLLIAGFLFSNQCPYVYGYSTLSTFSKNENQIAEEKVNSTFGSTNTIAVLVPTGNYEKEGQLIRELEDMEEVDSVLGLANVEAMDGYVLTDRLSPRQFAELTDLDIEVSRLLYSAYAVDESMYGKIVSGIDNYSVPLIDMFMFLYGQVQDGYVTLDDELSDTLEDLHGQLVDAQLQLKGTDFSRIVVQLKLPEEGKETFAFLSTMHDAAEKYYSDSVYLVGDSTSDYDLSSSFENDNILIGVLTLVFVIIVLIFTFKSAGLPVLLILVIQGSIWINFSFPYLTGTNLFFLSYLVVSSIQMGANIDYAIVITNRYTTLKQQMPIRKAIVESLNQSFPTIITSGSMLAAAGILIGFLSSDPAISSIGICLGRGTIISILLVMGVLPQILLLGDTIIEKTSFTLKHAGILQTKTGSIHLNGHVRGYLSGIVDADFNGSLNGSLNAMIEAGGEDKLPAPQEMGSETDVAGEGGEQTEDEKSNGENSKNEKEDDES